MNKNGFAISTLLYGLSLMGVMIAILMMSIMSSNRKNTSTLVKDIEEELNRISITNTTINTDGENKPYSVPEGEAGWYKIQLWGANNGAYTSGIIYLDAGQELYFDIGKKGANESSEVRVSNDINTQSQNNGAGSEIRKYTTIMRAAGGPSATGPQQDGDNEATTGSFIAGYPGCRSYKPKRNSRNENDHPWNDYYIVGDISLAYSPFEVNNDDHIFSNPPEKYFAFLDPYMVLAAGDANNGKAKIDKVSNNDAGHPPIAISDAAKFTSISDTPSNKNFREIQAVYYDGTTREVKRGVTSTIDKSNDNNLNSSLTAETKTQSVSSQTYYNVVIYHLTNTTPANITETLKLGSTEYKLSHKENTVGLNYSLINASAFGFVNGKFPDNSDFWISPAGSPQSLISSKLEGNLTTTKLADTQNQKWHFERISGKNFKILESTKNNSLRVDAVDEENANAEPGTPVSSRYTYNNLAEEQWTLEMDDNDKMYFKIKSTKLKTRSNQALYLTISGSSVTVNTAGNGGTQKFFLKNLSY